MAKKKVTLDDLALMVAKGFGNVDDRFDGVDSRFDGVDSRLDGNDRHHAGQDLRLSRIEGKLDAVIEIVRRHDHDIKVLKSRR